MKTMNILRILIAILAFSAMPAQAEIDHGAVSVTIDGRWGHKPVGIFQYGQLVGQAWVSGTADPCQYTEHWHLSPSYVYPNSPGEGEIIETTIRALEDAPAFATAADFNVHASSIMPGGKRILVPVLELERCGPDQGIDW